MLKTPTMACICTVMMLAGPSSGLAADLILEFPQEAAVGVVISSPLSYSELFGEPIWHQTTAQRAQGRLRFNSDHYIGLEIAGRHGGDLSFLERLPTDALESLSISGAKIDHTQLAHIARFVSLKKLTFRNCKITSGAFASLERSLPDRKSVV